jgi:hypothetical protein
MGGNVGEYQSTPFRSHRQQLGVARARREGVDGDVGEAVSQADEHATGIPPRASQQVKHARVSAHPRAHATSSTALKTRQGSSSPHGCAAMPCPANRRWAAQIGMNRKVGESQSLPRFHNKHARTTDEMDRKVGESQSLLRFSSRCIRVDRTAGPAPTRAGTRRAWRLGRHAAPCRQGRRAPRAAAAAHSAGPAPAIHPALMMRRARHLPATAPQ